MEQEKVSMIRKRHNHTLQTEPGIVRKSREYARGRLGQNSHPRSRILPLMGPREKWESP